VAVAAPRSCRSSGNRRVGRAAGRGIILTDLCGSFPSHGPDYPVVWASTEEDLTAPFGETIHVSND
jgi:hypothetical protein